MRKLVDHQCPKCEKKEQLKYPTFWYRTRRGTGFCNSCSRAGGNKTSFKKGLVPWNTGLNISGMSGKKQSEKQKQAMRIRNANYVFTDDVRDKMRKAKLGKTGGTLGMTWKQDPEKVAKIKRRRGQEHYNWTADRSLLKQDEKKHLDSRYREWMKGVKNRDGWTCRIADVKCNGRLEAHHILRWIDFPELRYDINNGITLCHAHHPRKRAEEKRLAPLFAELVSVSS